MFECIKVKISRSNYSFFLENYSQPFLPLCYLFGLFKSFYFGKLALNALNFSWPLTSK